MCGIAALRPEPPRIQPFGHERLHQHGETLPESRDGAIGGLAVAPQVQAHHLAIVEILDEAANAVREVFPVDPACTGAVPFGEDRQGVPVLQQVGAFLEDFGNLFAVSAPLEWDAFHQVAQDDQEWIPVKIVPFREIPGDSAVLE